MAGFVERWPAIVRPGPGGPADPLGESVWQPRWSACRVFTPDCSAIVIGRNQDPWREVRVEQAQADGWPIYRRVTGGGTVLLTPGCVVVACRLQRCRIDTQWYFDAINRVIGPTIAELCGRPWTTRGHGDGCIEVAPGDLRKVVGASQRQNREQAVYLGVVLIEDCCLAMERYLAAPSRQPAYRRDRAHGDFCWPLSRDGVTTATATTALRAALQASDLPWAAVQPGAS